MKDRRDLCGQLKPSCVDRIWDCLAMEKKVQVLMCWVSNWNSWNGSHGAAAFLASLGASALLVQEIRTAHQEDLGSETYVVGAVADLNRHLATPLTYGEARAQNQKSLSAQIDEEAATRLKQSAVETRDTARLNCVARPDAGDWLPKGTWWPSPRFWRSACADVTRLGLKYQNIQGCDFVHYTGCLF